MGFSLKRQSYGFQDAVKFAINLIIPEPQYPVSELLENAIALGVAPTMLIETVLMAVHLYDDARTTAFEIHDVVREW